MKTVLRVILALTFLNILHPSLTAQGKSNVPVKVAVFVPIYINTAFDGSNYKLGNNSLPKQILPGLEFYNGVMMAIDSLKNEGLTAEISIYDTKDLADFNRVISGSALNNTGLIIAAITNLSELNQLGKAAQRKGIPLISVTYPNTGNMTQNPYFVLLNSSLQAHLEGIYKYLQRNHALNNIVFFNRNGNVEKYLKNTFTGMNKATLSVPLKMKWVELPDTFSLHQVSRVLDSTKKNIVVVASPYENFGAEVVRAITSTEYPATVIGMPTWDGVRDFNKAGYNVEIVYSTPFNYSRGENLEANLARNYREKFLSRPSDMVYRGYETVYHFTKLLANYGPDFKNKLSEQDHTLFNQFDIQPVRLRKDSKEPDYFENKKLYFIKKKEGATLSVTSL